jgi:hypothetical protein
VSSSDDQVDLEKLAEEAEREAREAGELADSLTKKAEEPDSSGELVSELSSQLAKIRRVSDLPDKDANQFAQAIRFQQHEDD